MAEAGHTQKERAVKSGDKAFGSGGRRLVSGCVMQLRLLSNMALASARSIRYRVYPLFLQK